MLCLAKQSAHWFSCTTVAVAFFSAKPSKVASAEFGGQSFSSGPPDGGNRVVIQPMILHPATSLVLKQAGKSRTI